MHEVLELRNVARHRRARFELDPAGLVTAERGARARGAEILGVWHSHPDRAAQPSELDRRAACGGWAHVIVAVHRAIPGVVAAWRLDGDGLRALGLRPVSPLGGPMSGNGEGGPSGPARVGRP